MISREKFYELYNRNSRKNKERSVGEFTNKYFRRDLSLYVAYFLAKSNISANKVTMAFLCVGLLANVIFAIPGITTIIIMAFLYQIVDLLDCVDGQLARYFGTSSIYGELLDIIVEMIVLGSFMIGFGLRLYFETNNILYLIFSSIGALSYVIEGLWAKVSKDIYGEMSSDNEESLMQKFRTLYINLNNMTVLPIIILLLSIIDSNLHSINLLGIFYILFVIFSFTTKVTLRLLATLRKAEEVKQNIWKGWE